MQSEIKQRISVFQLSKKELKKIKGGFCGCGCFYENCPGGSSSEDNSNANFDGGKISKPPVDPMNPC